MPSPIIGPTPSPTASPFVIEGEGNQTALFYVVHPGGDPNSMAQVLLKNPELKLTVIFPPRYFETPSRREFIPVFRVLQSSGQIEIGLTIENEPNLPLLGNFDLTEGSLHTPWDVDFSFPDDIEGQIARASSAYQRRWGRLPAGLYPPYLSVSDHVMKAAQKFRMNWILGSPQEIGGARFFGSAALLIPEIPPIWDDVDEGSEKWAIQLSSWAVNSPFALVDASLWNDPNSEKTFFEKLSRVIYTSGSPSRLIFGEELPPQIPESLLLPRTSNVFATNFSDWVRSPQQRVAWQALADTRRALETYKKSGRAILKQLDAAFEEMYTAESGPFLLSLGQSVIPLPINERIFIATLANVYRHTQTPVPPNLNRLFSYKRYQGATDKSSTSDKPFFQSNDKTSIWNDPMGDDFGPGPFRYPAGPYAKGCFDLERFSVRWTEDFVTLTVTLGGTLPSERLNLILPLVDIYIDVNRIAGAGSINTLPQRGQMAIENDAAWEYALTMTMTEAVLYQPLPGKEPRKRGSYHPDVDGPNKSISVSIPLDIVRGNPVDWRMTVGIGGWEQKPTPVDLVPIPVMVNMSDKTFGGAKSGRKAPRYMDILAASMEDQKSCLQNYESGSVVTLPFVETP